MTVTRLTLLTLVLATFAAGSLVVLPPGQAQGAAVDPPRHGQPAEFGIAGRFEAEKRSAPEHPLPPQF